MPWPPLVAPVFLPGTEPLPPGFTEDDRFAAAEARKYENLLKFGVESCVAKTAIAGGGG